MPEQIYDCGFCGTEVRADAAELVQILAMGRYSYIRAHKQCAERVHSGKLTIRSTSNGSGDPRGEVA